MNGAQYEAELARQDWRRRYLWVPLGLLLGLFCLFLLTTPFRGCYPGYSMGERVGFVVKFSESGVIWKTWNGEIQVSTGNTAIQEPFRFSVRDVRIIEKTKAMLGKQVRVKYRQWLIKPIPEQGTNYEILEIEETE